MATTELIAITDIEWRYQDAKDRLEGLEVTTDDDYEQVCALAKAIGATEKEVADTEEQAKIKEIEKELKPIKAQVKGIADKLSEIKSICRGHIAAYAGRKSREQLEEAQEKALRAAIELGDESYLDLVSIDSESVPKVPGIVFSEVTGIEITDESAIPDEYKKIDTSAIRKVVQALGEQHGIPGVTMSKKTQVRVSAGK